MTDLIIIVSVLGGGIWWNTLMCSVYLKQIRDKR